MQQNKIIEIYSTVTELTGAMLLAARAGEWDRLSAIESDCARQVQILKQMEPVDPLTGSEKEQKVSYIRQILANDRDIRAITEPWMEHLSQLLSRQGTQRKLNSSYGATPPV
jgi:flagellar protein FliT